MRNGNWSGKIEIGRFVGRLLRPADWPLATKLLLTFVLTALLPLLVVGWYGYTVARQTVMEAQVRALSGHATDLAETLDLVLADRQQVVRQLAEDSEVKAFVAAWPEVPTEMEQRVQNHLDNLVNVIPYFHIARLLNRNGHVILSATGEIGVDYSFRAYFEQALSGNVYVSDILVSVDSGLPVIYFSAPIRNEAGQVVAVAVLGLHADVVWSLVEAEKDQIGPGSVAVLFDEYGLRLAHSSDHSVIFKAVVPLDPQVEAQLLARRRMGTAERIESTNLPDLAEGLRQAGSQPLFVYRMATGDDLFHAVAVRMSTKSWTVVQAVPEAAFLAPINQLRQAISLAAGWVALLALFITVMAIRWTVRPVQALTTAAQQLAAGELNHTVADLHSQRRDELGVLLHSFETMRIALQQSHDELAARNQRLQRLYELAVTLTGGVTEVADHVVTIITQLLDVKIAIVEEIHHDQIIVLSMCHHDQIINEGNFPLRGTPCENVQEEKGICHYTQVVEQFPDDPFLAEHGLTSYLGVPILDSQGEVLGVVNAMDDRERDFDEADSHLLQTLANRVSVEIERAQAEAEIRQRAGELEAIAEVGGLVTAGGDQQSTLNTLARKIAQATGFDWVTINLYDAEKEEMTFSALFTASHIKPLEERRGTTARLKDVPMLQQLLHEKKHILMDSPQHDPRVPARLRVLAKGDGIQTIMIWPLLYGGELIGKLDFYSMQTRKFSPNDIRMLSTLADQTAAAVQNARLFAETEQYLRELSILLDLSESLRASLQKDEMLSLILEQAQVGVNATGAIVFAQDEGDGNLWVQAARGSFENLAGRTYPLEAMPAACAMRVGGHCFGQDDCPFLPDSGRPLQTVCVTFEAGGQIIGGLQVYASQAQAFSENDLRLLRGIAGIAANALRRATLFEEMRLYKNSFQSTADAIITTDLDTRILNINAAFEKVTGYSHAEALGKNPGQLIKSQHSTPAFYRQMWDQILTEGYWAGEIINRRKNGEEWDSFLTISMVKDERGQPVAYVGINRDITRLKDMQRELQASHATLEQRVAERTKELALANRELRRLDHIRADLLANVSHELRTPLIPITSLAQLMLGGKAGPLTGEQQQYLQTMVRSVGRMERFSEQLLGTVRRDQGRERLHPTRLDLCQILRESAGTVSPAVKTKNLHFDLQLPEEPLWVEGDSGMLHQVFDNLLSNAAKFTPAGGRVALAAWSRGADANDRLSMANDQLSTSELHSPKSKIANPKLVIVEISDTGIGISKEEQAHIFERFYQATGGGYTVGTGLGLAIVKELVELHEGHVGVRSTLGEGSTFTVVLPGARQ